MLPVLTAESESLLSSGSCSPLKIRPQVSGRRHLLASAGIFALILALRLLIVSDCSTCAGRLGGAHVGGWAWESQVVRPRVECDSVRGGDGGADDGGGGGGVCVSVSVSV